MKIWHGFPFSAMRLLQEILSMFQESLGQNTISWKLSKEVCPKKQTARITLGVKELALGASVEMDCIAYKPKK